MALFRHPEFRLFLCLFLLILLFLWQGLSGQKTLIPVDVLHSYYPWKADVAQSGIAAPQNELMSDMALQNLGWKELVKRSILSGELPLWNPYMMSGIPLLGEGQVAALYPPGIFFFTLLPIPQAYLWFTAFHLLLGGLFTYAFLRTLQSGRIGALVSALTFAFCGFLTVSIQWPQVVSSAVWLPLVLLAVEQIIRRRTGEESPGRADLWARWLGAPFWLLVGAAAVCLSLLAGFLEISIYILSLTAGYAVFRTLLSAKESGNTRASISVFLLLGAMAALGIVLAGAQLIPMIELLRENFRSGSVSFSQAMNYGLPLKQVLAFFIPDIFGNPTHQSYFNLVSGQVESFFSAGDGARPYPYWGAKDYVEGAGYLGLLPILLAGIAVARRRDRYTLFFAVASFVALLFAFGTPLYALVYYGIPGFDQVRSPFRWLIVYSFCVAALAGLGVDALMAARERIFSGIIVRGLLQWIGHGMFAIGMLTIVFIATTRLFLAQSLAVAENIMARSDKLTQAFTSASSFYSFEAINLLSFGAILAVSGLAIWGMLHWRHLSTSLLLPAVIVLDLFMFGWGYIRFNDTSAVDKTSPALAWLQQDPELFRIAAYGQGETLPPNTAMLSGLQDVQGYDSIIPKQYVEYWRLIEEPYLLQYNRLGSFRTGSALASPLLDMLNVKYVVSREPLQQAGFTQVYADEVYIYRNEQRLPRAYAVFNADYTQDRQSALALLKEAAFDPHATVIVEGARGPQRQSSPRPLAPATIVDYQANTVVLSVDMPESGYLVLNDAFFPGWRARDGDGNELEIRRANGNFRAVSLPSGRYTVIFSYFPDSFKLGLYVSFLGVVLSLLTASYWAWRRFYDEGIETSAARRVAKNSITPMTAQILARAVDFGFAVFMLRLLGPQSYGGYAFAVALIGYFAIVTDYGLGTLLTREVARDRSQAQRFVAVSIGMRLILSAAATPLLLALVWGYHLLFGLAEEAVIAACLFMLALFPSAVAGQLSAVLSSYERMEFQGIVNILSTVFRAALGIVALLLGWGVVGLGMVSVATSMVNAAIFYVLVRRFFFAPGLSFDIRAGKELLGASTPLMFNNLLNSIFFRVDMLLLQPMRGVQSVGYYSTAYKFVEGLLMIPAFFTLALFPTMSRYAQSAPELLVKAYVSGMKALFLLSLPITIAITLTADQLILLFFGQQYAPAIQALKILIWFLPFSYVNGITQYLLIAVNRQRYLTIAFVIGTAFNLVANLIAIPLYGIEGAAAVTVMSEVVLMVPFMVGVYRYIGPLPIRKLGLQAVAAALLMGLALSGLNSTPFWVSVPLTGLIYGGGLLLFRVFDADDRAILRSLLAR